MSGSLEKDLEALRASLTQKVEEIEAEQKAEANAEAHEEMLREVLQGEFPQLSPDVVEGEVRNRLKSKREEVPREEREGVRKSAPEFVQEPPTLRKSRLVAVALLAILVSVGVVVLIGFMWKYVSQGGEETVEFQPSYSFEAEELLTVDHQPGSNRAEITVKASSKASQVILYENMRVLRRWRNSGKMKMVVFHERGVYVYFAEIYFGNEKVSTDQARVDFGE